MSYQTSIHFDPTALLIIKNEVDNSIQLVESAVSSLVEDQTLPFGIDDALNQFEQCAQVLALIDMPNLATIAQDSAQLMRKIMQNPSEIQQQDVTALSNGTSILKRYVEFICLQEVKVTPFLLSTLNRLELALGKPLTQEGSALASLLDCVTPDFQLPPISSQPKSVHVHRLYKLVLSKALKKQPHGADLQGFKLVGDYLADTAQHMPSQQYWQLVQIAFSDLENTLWHEARLRTLIAVERHIATFFTQPDTFEPSLEDVSNILNLCVSQDSNIAEHLRHQLNIQDEVLTNTQLQLYSRHLYGPDFNTMHTISTLVTEEISEVRNAIEHNYQNISAERIEELQVKLKEIANIFTVLNLNKISHNLTHQAQLLNADILRDENFVQQFMNCIQSAINAVGVLERKHNSNRLQFAVNNTNISLDRLDEAHEVLLNEAKILIDSTSQTLTKYLDDKNLENLENAANQIDEISGAMLFLNGQAGQEALKVASSFVQQQFEAKQEISEEQIDAILDALASADMLIDNLRNKQPVMCSMFDVALQSSQKLKNVA